MNKKGFTLVELLATIVLLCLIILLATFTINKNINDAKKRSHNAQVDTVLSAAITYANQEEIVTLTNIDGYQITLKEMADKGYVDKDIKDPLNGKEFDMESSYVKIEVVSSANTDTSDIKDYKYDGNYLFTLHAVYK